MPLFYCLEFFTVFHKNITSLLYFRASEVGCSTEMNTYTVIGILGVCIYIYGCFGNIIRTAKNALGQTSITSYGTSVLLDVTFCCHFVLTKNFQFIAPNLTEAVLKTLH